MNLLKNLKQMKMNIKIECGGRHTILSINDCYFSRHNEEMQKYYNCLSDGDVEKANTHLISANGCIAEVGKMFFNAIMELKQVRYD